MRFKKFKLPSVSLKKGQKPVPAEGTAAPTTPVKTKKEKVKQPRVYRGKKIEGCEAYIRGGILCYTVEGVSADAVVAGVAKRFGPNGHIAVFQMFGKSDGSAFATLWAMKARRADKIAARWAAQDKREQEKARAAEERQKAKTTASKSTAVVSPSPEPATEAAA